MRNELQRAFDPIQADEALKASTRAYIQKKIQSAPRPARRRYALATICLALVLLVGIGGYQIWSTPVSFISIDVNPSVELGLNRFDRVVSTHAYNEDGALILEDVNVEGMAYTTAVDTLLKSEAMDAYLTDDAALSLTVASDNEAQLLAGLQTTQSCQQYHASCESVNLDTLADAHAHGLSFGKYQAYLELSQYDTSITPEDCHDMSMRQIRDRIAACQSDQEHTSQAASDTASENGYGENGHHGHGHGGGIHE